MKIAVFSWVLLISVSLVMLGRAAHLQVVTGKEQLTRSQKNRFRVSSIPARRGIFFDLLGKPLVKQSDHEREYLYPETLSHVIGYVGEVSESDLTLFGVEAGEVVGKTGIEREEDGLLRGITGGMVEEYSASGEQVRILSQTESVAGRHVQLSIDIGLQQLAYQLLEASGKLGAAIVSTIDGKLLVLASYPGFNPNIFLPQKELNFKENQAIHQVFNDPNKPLFNRAIGGVYPPASTFKLVTALAALEEGVVKDTETVEDTGFITVGEFRYGNWYYDQYGKKDGAVDLYKGLQRSNDIYFYRVGEALGVEQLSDWANRLGLGKHTGIAMIGEAKGLVPNPTWKLEAMGEPWYLGDTYISSIGQGNLQVTPLQIHLLTTLIANRGYLCKPTLVLNAVDKEPAAVNPLATQNLQGCQKIAVHSQHIEAIMKGMQMACEPGGTGWPLFNFTAHNESFEKNSWIDGVNYIKNASSSGAVVQIPIACKTGTAETGKMVIENKKKKYLTHAWLVAFAPIQEPEVVVTVLLEEGGQGSDAAAPIAKALLQYWFEHKQ